MTRESRTKIENCGLIKLSQLLGKKWSLPILHSFIFDEIQTFGQIEKKFRNDIHPTTLSNRLKAFERFNIILREQNTYKITAFGKLLIKTQYDLKVKAKQNNLSIPEECEHGECICNKFFMK